MATGVVDPLRPRKNFKDEALKSKHVGVEKMYASALGKDTSDLVSFKEYKVGAQFMCVCSAGTMDTI